MNQFDGYLVPVEPCEHGCYDPHVVAVNHGAAFDGGADFTMCNGAPNATEEDPYTVKVEMPLRRPACVYCENPIREEQRFTDQAGHQWHIECEPTSPAATLPDEIGDWRLVATRASVDDEWEFEWRRL